MALTVTTLRGPPARTDLHVAEAAYSMAELYREPSGLPRAESEPLGRPDGEARTGHSWTTRSADSRAPALGSGQPGPSLQAPRKPWFGGHSESRDNAGAAALNRIRKRRVGQATAPQGHSSAVVLIKTSLINSGQRDSMQATRCFPERAAGMGLGSTSHTGRSSPTAASLGGFWS